MAPKSFRENSNEFSHSALKQTKELAELSDKKSDLGCHAGKIVICFQFHTT